MIEFIKCLVTGLVFFTVMAIVIILINFAGQMWPSAFPWVLSGVFTFGMALWLGAFIRNS